MKKAFTYLAAIFLIITCNRIIAQNFKWAKQLGGGSCDGGSSIAIDENENIYTTGHFYGTADFDPGAGTCYLTTAGYHDIFISKLDYNGNYVWAKKMGGESTDKGYSIVIDSQGNIYTVGIFCVTADFDPDTSTYNLTSAGHTDIFICKMDNNGSFIWAKQLGGGAYDYGYSMCVGINGNIYITGSFEGTADFDPGDGTYNLTSNGYNDIFICKLNTSGSFMWAKQLGGSSYDQGNSIAIDANENVYTTGYFYGTSDFDPGQGTYNLTTAGDYDVFISKIDSSGNFIWAKQLGGEDYDKGYSIKVDNEGNIYTTGCFQGSSNFDPGAGSFYLTSEGSFDIFISKLNNLGNFVWAKQLGGGAFDKGYSITLDSLYNIITTGVFYSTADFDPGPESFYLTSEGEGDIFVNKLDSAGNFIWAVQMGGREGDGGSSVASYANGCVYTTGSFSDQADFDPGLGTFYLTSFGISDIFVHKLYGITTDIQNNTFGKSFAVFPNPTSGELTIDLGKLYTGVTIDVKNLMGKIISSSYYSSTKKQVVDIEGYAGCYFVDIKTSEGKSSTIKIIKH